MDGTLMYMGTLKGLEGGLYDVKVYLKLRNE